MAAPVVVVASGGLPVTNLGAAGATPLTVVSSSGAPITLVASGGLPVTLLNPDGSLYSSGFDPDSLILFAAMTTPPSDTRKAVIDAYITALKAMGAWSQLDVLDVLAAADSQAALLNWKSPGTFNPTATGPPTFTADRGFAGDGTTSHLDANWTPSTNAVNYTRDNASAWIWLRTDSLNNKGDMGNVSTPNLFIVARTASNNFTNRINDGTTDNVASIGSAIGLSGAQRTSSTAKVSWRNGVSVGTFARASTGLPTQSQWIGGGNSSDFETRQVAFAAYGASLAGIELAFYNATLAYLQGVGAA